MTEHKKKPSEETPEEQSAGSVNGTPTNPTPEGEKDAQATMLALTVQEYDALQKAIEEAKNQAKINFEGWQRERADFLNYKKRIEKDQELSRSNILAEVIKKYLVMQDDLERALKSLPPDLQGSTWVEGIEHIYRKLLTLLEKEGVQRIDPQGEMFDPTIHEAVVQEENPDHESGRIIEVITPGYQIGDRVIRPARVKVAH